MKTQPSWVKAPGVLEVRVNDNSELGKALERALGVVQEAAAEHQIGILITQVDTGTYVVRAHPAVPVGLVRERINQSPGS